MATLLLIITCVGTVYSVIKVFHDIIIHKAWKDIRNSHEFKILIISIISTIIILFPWSKVHYGNSESKIVYVDSSKLKKVKKEDIKPIIAKNETVFIKQEAPRYFKGSPKKITGIPKKVLIPPVNGVISTGSNAHNVAGTGNHVDVNGDQYNGIKQRHLTDAILLSILTQLSKDKSIRINFTFTAAGDKELLDYANEIVNALLKNGYSILIHLQLLHFLYQLNSEK